MRNIMARLVVVLFLLGPASVVGVHPPNCPPTKSPAPTETAAPSPSPSPVPTDTQKPSTSLYPSVSPTEYPTTSEPSPTPTEVPTESPAPSPSPSEAPTKSPTAAPTVSVAPTISQAPTSTPKPSPEPTAHPSGVPSVTPTASGMPSHVPSLLPSVSPSTLPTMAPTISNAPSVSAIPSSNPSEAPSPMPSAKPSDMPSPSPTVSSAPSEIPSVMPSPQPSPKPSAFPSDQPTSMPSNLPSLQPTRMPSSVPSTEPTDVPTVSSAPSMQPSVSHMPSMSIAPSTTPSSNPTAGTRIFKSEKIHITMYELSTIMDANVQEIFERTTVTFINNNLNTRQKPTVTIEEVEVTAQLLSWERRRLQVSGEGFYDLRITFTVTASVWRGDPENFDFSSLMRDSFTEIDVLGLRKILDEISSFFGEFSPGGSQGGMARGQGSISTDVSRGFPIPVIGAVAGVLLSIAGSAMVFYLWRGARSDESISDDSRDFDLEAPVYSSGSSDDGGDHIMVKHISFDASESSMPLGARRLEHDTNVYPVKSIETSLMPAYGACHFAQNLLRFETNIEVPETPRPETPSPPFDLPRFDEDDVKVPFSMSVTQKLDADLKKLYQGWSGTDAKKAHKVVVPVNEVKGSQQSSHSRQSIRMVDVKKIFFQGWNGTDARNKTGHKVVVPVNEVNGSQQSSRMARSNSDLRQSIRMVDVTSDAEQVSNITHRSESLDGDSRTMVSSPIEPFDDAEVVMIEDKNIGIIDEIGYLHKEKSSSKSQPGLLGNLYIASRSDQKLRKAQLSETSFGSRVRNRANSYFSETSESSAEI